MLGTAGVTMPESLKKKPATYDAFLSDLIWAIERTTRKEDDGLQLTTEIGDGSEGSFDPQDDGLQLSQLTTETGDGSESTFHPQDDGLQLTTDTGAGPESSLDPQDDDLPLPQLTTETGDGSENSFDPQDDNLQVPQLVTETGVGPESSFDPQVDGLQLPQLTTETGAESENFFDPQDDDLRLPQLTTETGDGSEKSFDPQDEDLQLSQLTTKTGSRPEGSFDPQDDDLQLSQLTKKTGSRPEGSFDPQDDDLQLSQLTTKTGCRPEGSFDPHDDCLQLPRVTTEMGDGSEGTIEVMDAYDWQSNKRKKTMIVEDSADTSDSEVFPMLSRPAKMRKSHLLDTDDEDDAETFDEKKTARDISHKDIYVSLVKDKYVSGKHTKTNRTYDSRHPCIFCSKTVCNFSHHILTRKHSNEDEVKQILNSCGKERKNLIAKLRLKAAHNHNINVLKRNKGEIFLLRRSRYEAGESEEDESEEDDEGKGDKCEQTIDIRKYGPCPRCLGWILLASIKRHFKVCCAADPNLSLSYTKNSLIVQSDIIMGKVTDEASPALVKEVFPIMLVDDVSKVAKHDDLIVNLGNQWMLRNRGNEIMRKYYTSSVMRLVAKLKKNCQMISELNDESMDGFLQPKHFDVVVKAALLCSAGDEEDLEDLKSPSNAVKLGHDIKRMLSTKLAKGIKESDNQKKKEAEEFRKLMDIEWGLRVTKLARSLMIEATFNQERKLPLPNDLKKLAQFLTNEIKDLDLEDATFAQFRKVANLNLVRITLYNRRRCHEVQAMRLTAYEMRKTGIDEVGAEIRGELTNFERHLLEHQDVVVLRGKTGRGVPVILPNDVKGSLQYLSNSTVRKSAGIPPNNKYVFANAGAGVFRAYDAIRDITQDPKAGLQMPSLIRTSNMRKYTATMLQAMNTTDAERQWVIDHLGHTMNVHREHYRQTSDLLERVEVAKILLIQDLNLVGKFHGKKLKDIQLDDIVATADVDANADHPAASDEPTEHIPVARAAAIGQNDEYIPDLDEMQQSEEDDYCNEDYSKKKRKKAASSCTRQMWTQEEKDELEILFSKELKTNKLPGQKRIEQLMFKSKCQKGVIHLRKRDTIKKKLCNMMTKKRSQQFT